MIITVIFINTSLHLKTLHFLTYAIIIKGIITIIRRIKNIYVFFISVN